MHNQHQTTNHNKVKAVGLGLLMILMAIAYFSNKSPSDSFGLPFDQIDSLNNNPNTPLND
jgi:hypothetical protein